MDAFARFAFPTLLVIAACGGTETTPGTTTTNTTTGTETSTTTASGGSGGAGTTTSTTSMSTTSSSTGTGGAGGGACVPTGTGGTGGAVDEADPCGSITGPGAPAERIAWVVKGDPKIDITSQISLLWGFQYVTRVPPADAAEYTIEHIRCTQAAGAAESCVTFDMPLPVEECAVANAPKYGIDPSQYMPGTNHYWFAIRLVRGCQIVSQDAFTIVVQYTP